ncbi:MAG: ATP-binding protein [Eubacterium sp.]|uniref:ATP-binding protein n=1 Tax=Eubacterium sp. TaxID=142586 RepID=UPI003992AEFA
MGLTREQFDIIYNKYNNRRLDNSIKQDKRLKEVYEKVPAIKECDLKISSLAVNAARSALNGDTSLKDNLKENIAQVSNQKRALLLANGFSGDYLEPIYDCPICEDTGFVNGQPCQCLQKEVIKSLYTTKELNDILQKENFNTFDFSLYSNDFIDDTTGLAALDNIKEVVTFCKGFVDKFDNIDNNSILFYGRAGSGKTFLINCIANELINKSYTVLYLSAVSFFDLLSKVTFNKGESAAIGQITKHELLQCDVLIVDDLGSEMANSFTVSALFDCLNYRLIHHKSTIISTNYSMTELNELYTDRIFSRILGNYNTFKIFGDDIRTKKFIN